MGAQEIRDAFNGVSVELQASVVLVWVERDEAGKEWQVIRFRGNTAAGENFDIKTERHSPNDDPVLIAREEAKKFASGAGLAGPETE